MSIPAPKVSVAVIMLFQVAALFLREFTRRFLISEGTAPAMAHEQSAWVGFVVLSVLMSPYLRQNGSFVRSLFRPPESWTRLILLSIAIGAILRVASWGSAFLALSSRPGSLDGIWTPLDNGLQWGCPDAVFLAASITTMVVATPFIEEVVNRGFILRTLVQNNYRYPMLAAAVLFALLHRPGGMLAALIFGLIAATQMMKGRSIWGPLIAHATFNALIVIDDYCVEFGNAEIALLLLDQFELVSLGATVLVVPALLAYWLASHPGTGAWRPGTSSPSKVPERLVQ